MKQKQTVFKIWQSNVHLKKWGDVAKSVIARVWMNRPQGGETITRGVMSSQNPRQSIIRRRKREQEPRQTIIWVRKCEPNFGQAITRGWMRQTERGAGYHSVVTAIGARVNAQNNHLRNIPHKKHFHSSHFRTEYPRYLQESQLCRTFVIEYVIFLIVVRLIEKK